MFSRLRQRFILDAFATVSKTYVLYLEIAFAHISGDVHHTKQLSQDDFIKIWWNKDKMREVQIPVAQRMHQKNVLIAALIYTDAWMSCYKSCWISLDIKYLMHVLLAM